LGAIVVNMADPEDQAPEDFFDLSVKKKKKKKKGTFEMPAEEPQVEVVPELAPDVAQPLDEAVASVVGDFDFTKKKKKKKAAPKDFDEGIVVGEEKIEPAAEGWTDTDRDYTYDELLELVFSTIRQKNPDMVVGERRVICMRAPQVARIGTRRTGFSNFMDVCKAVHRQPEHIMAFVLAELGAPGSMDGQSQLVIKGRFSPKQIENVLRRYIREYVTCHTCRSPDTILTKENRLFFLQCETCGAQCSVAAIQSGFQAVTGKRKKLALKQP